MARPTKWLVNARKRAGFGSQDQLAKALGVSRGAVGNWENGTDRPSMENAERLAVHLKRQRAEVLAIFGYPIGGGDPAIEMPVGLPPEWADAIAKAVAAGVSAGVAQAIELLNLDAQSGAGGRPAAPPRRRQSA